MRLSDFVMETLADLGLKQVFMITGGGAMHLNDAVGRCTRVKYVCCHHEQACAMAAESYARVSGKPALLQITTGPGGINALNGVYGAYMDSMPMVIISGQVKRETCMAFYELPGLRQLGDQEVDIVAMVKKITKHAVLIRHPDEILLEVQRAWHLATSGRPGPCWIDIPVDLQGMQIDPAKLVGFDPTTEDDLFEKHAVLEQIPELVKALNEAERPVILVGSGVRVAGAQTIFEEVITQMGIPVVEAWSAPDALPQDHPLLCGRAGTIGDRAGNFAVQNADLLLILGSRLPLRQVSYNWTSFARHAWKVMVDIDVAEFEKPTIKPDLGIHSDAKFFLQELSKAYRGGPDQTHASWLAWCKERVTKYPIVQARQSESMSPGKLNPYPVLEALIDELAEGDVMVCGDGTASVVTYQVAKIKPRQRLYGNAGDASMGYDLPASLGAAVAVAEQGAAGPGRVICFAGDGSLMMNLQELQTLAHHRFPVKLFILNNGGYVSIRSTQNNYFGGFLVGEGPSSGVSFPDFSKIAPAFGLPFVRIETTDYLPMLKKVLAEPGPVVCEIMFDPDHQFEPKLSSKRLADGRMVSAPLEDLFPFLDREELLSNLLVPPWPET